MTSARMSSQPVSRNSNASKNRMSVPTAKPLRKVFTLLLRRLAGWTAGTWFRELFEGNCQFKVLHNKRIADDLDAGDLAIRERESENPEQATSGGDHHTDIAIHQNRVGEASATGGGDCLPGPGRRAACFSRDARCRGSFVDVNGDVGIEHGDESVEVCRSQGSDEFVDDFPLLREFGTGSRRRALHAAARPTGELTCSFGSAADDLCYLVERRAEEIVKDEGEPLGGIEAIENDEQREADGIGQHGFLFGVDLFRNNRRRWRIGSSSGEGFLAARIARAKHVEADPRDNRGQPTTEIFDRVGVRTVET
jgi:hypothetical protein